MEQLDYLALLDEVLAELPALLASPAGWRGMRIDYRAPFVDRAWRTWRETFRISVHRIHPCEPAEALFHPHPWPSAMAIVAGRYVMGVGHGAGIVEPAVAMHVVATRGTRYAMTDRDAWHSVRPLDVPALSIMLSGPPWDRAMPIVPAEPQRSLAPHELAALLAEFEPAR